MASFQNEFKNAVIWTIIGLIALILLAGCRTPIIQPPISKEPRMEQLVRIFYGDDWTLEDVRSRERAIREYEENAVED